MKLSCTIFEMLLLMLLLLVCILMLG